VEWQRQGLGTREQGQEARDPRSEIRDQAAENSWRMLLAAAATGADAFALREEERLAAGSRLHADQHWPCARPLVVVGAPSVRGGSR
jgi:hypothetical protein